MTTAERDMLILADKLVAVEIQARQLLKFIDKSLADGVGEPPDARGLRLALVDLDIARENAK